MRLARRTTRTAVLATALGVTLALSSACGSDEDDNSSENSSETDDNDDDDDDDRDEIEAIELDRPEVDEVDGDESEYPITIEHAFGTAEITEQPQRIVTLGPIETDAVLALEGPLVGVGALFGTDHAGEWIEDLIDDDIEVLSMENEMQYDLEEVAYLEPDLILAQSAYLDSAAYEMLSMIAPTVAQASADDYYVSPWQEVTQQVGEIIGQPDRADDLIDEAEAGIEEMADAYPDLDGQTYIRAWVVSEESIYLMGDPQDPLSIALDELGLEIDPVVDDLRDGDPDNPYAEITFKQLDELDADILIVSYGTEEMLDTFESSRNFDDIPSVDNGTYIALDGDDAASLSPFGPLSLSWGLNLLSETFATAASS